MKKLLLLSLFTASYLSANTELETAIIKSDYATVSKILKSQSLSDKEKDAYSELAEDIILSRRANTEYDWIKQFTNKKTIFGAIFTLFACHDLNTIDKLFTLKEINPKLFAQRTSVKDLEFQTALQSSLLFTSMLMFAYGIYDGANYRASLHENLENAEKIKFALLMANEA